MKSLLDIQQDIRKLENSVKDIANDIKKINSDIEGMRNVTQDIDIDYSMLEILAKQISFGKHPLYKISDKKVCQAYLEMLLNIAKINADADVTINRLIFIQWLQIQSKVEWTLKDLYIDSFMMSKKSYYEFAETMPEKYRESFIVDAMIVAGISGAPTREVVEYVVNLSLVLGVGKENLRILSLVSRVALSQSVKGVSKADLGILFPSIKSFKHYLGTDIAEQVIIGLREIVVELADGETIGFRWKVKDSHRVEESTVIATFEKEKRSKHVIEYMTEEIRATTSGILFQFRDNGTSYGVIAHESDDKRSIKTWVRSRGENN